MTRIFGTHPPDNGGMDMAVRRSANAGLQAVKIFTAIPKFYGDKSTIRPQYRALIRQVAAELNRDGKGVIGVIGRADLRGTNSYNVWLGLRRAKAVFEAISAELRPEVRRNVRMDITEDTGAKAGVGGH